MREPPQLRDGAGVWVGDDVYDGGLAASVGPFEGGP